MFQTFIFLISKSPVMVNYSFLGIMIIEDSFLYKNPASQGIKILESEIQKL